MGRPSLHGQQRGRPPLQRSVLALATTALATTTLGTRSSVQSAAAVGTASSALRHSHASRAPILCQRDLNRPGHASAGRGRLSCVVCRATNDPLRSARRLSLRRDYWLWLRPVRATPLNRARVRVRPVNACTALKWIARYVRRCFAGAHHSVASLRLLISRSSRSPACTRWT